MYEQEKGGSRPGSYWPNGQSVCDDCGGPVCQTGPPGVLETGLWAGFTHVVSSLPHTNITNERGRGVLFNHKAFLLTKVLLFIKCSGAGVGLPAGGEVRYRQFGSEQISIVSPSA